MSDHRLRRVVAIEAAKLMYEGSESEYFTAKRKVARRYGLNPRVQVRHLPSNREIREEILRLAQLYEGDDRLARLADMRLCAREIMRLLERYRPKLIGSVCTGHIRSGSDIDVHVFSDSVAAVVLALEEEQFECEVERKEVVKHGVARVFTHVHVPVGEHEVELTVYTADKATYPFISSITGEPIESLTLDELEVLLEDVPDPDEPTEEEVDAAFRRQYLRVLLKRLEGVKGGPHHPEGDQLYHSLQVFDLARAAVPYDRELAEAALLHDVGKAIDKLDHVTAGVDALRDVCSERVLWLIEHHIDALNLLSGKLGKRAARRLRADERFEDLMLLRQWDSEGRDPGASVPTLEEALDWVLEDEE